MALRINTNVASLNAQRNLNKSTMTLNRSLERLSSGLRINRAADDAAGLAISETMKSDIRALEQANRNAADGVSMVQLAEGALDEVSGILIRMRELAQQAGNETMGASERGYINSEFDALGQEITRISNATEFNGIKLLDGSGTTNDILVGTNTTDIIQIDLSNATAADDLGVDISQVQVDGADNSNALTAIDAVESAISTLNDWRADFGVTQNRLESAMRTIENTRENVSAANSRIRDVDIAAETSTMTSSQILQQAGVSVLAQANMSPQMALSLLQ
ncbi:MAG TPA: flagellin [Candidatus Krumholzibacteria bacterium]|nr:flagellin [Candidatus Krumholzibacteria bacterium]